MNVKQKEIVLFPFPFTDLRGKKVRPALVISNDYFNNKSDDCIMVPITSVIKDDSYSVIINQEDLISGKLIRPSRIKIDKIFSVEKKLIIMRIGVISNTMLEKVKNELFKLL